MNDAELQEMEERNWLRVDAQLRDRCVAHLRDVIPAYQQVWLRQCFETGGWQRGFHMFGGMGVRNVLREVAADDELPGVEYADGRTYRNWDDYYIAALRQAVAPKEGET